MQPNEEILKPLKFGNRMRKYILIPYKLDYISRHGNLNEAILKFDMKTFNGIENDMDGLWMPGTTEEEKKNHVKKIRKQIEDKSRKDMGNYFPILFNQALIMSCTVLDTFLVDSLKVLTNKQPNVLKGLASRDDVSIKELIDYSDYQKIFNHIQEKILKRFDFAGIEKKIKILRGLGIDMDTALGLKFHLPHFREKYPRGYEFLLDAYKKRHEIVHQDQLPLNTYQDLEEICSFFDGFMMDFAIITGRHFVIPVDFELFLKDPKSVDIDR